VIIDALQKHTGLLILCCAACPTDIAVVAVLLEDQDLQRWGFF